MDIQGFKRKYDIIYAEKQVVVSKTMSEAALKMAKIRKLTDLEKNDKDISKAITEADSRVRKLQEHEKYRLLAEEKYPALNKERNNLYNRLNRLKNVNPSEEDIKKNFGDMDTALKEGITSLNKLVELSIRETPKTGAAKIVDQLDSSYDQVLAEAAEAITGEKSTCFIEAWARTKFGDKMYDATSALKNGAADTLLGIKELEDIDDLFKGGLGSPEQAANKIKVGIQTIQDSTRRITAVCNDLFEAIAGHESVVLNNLDLSKNIGFASLGQAASIASMGIGSVAAFASRDFIGGINGGKDILKTTNNFKKVLKEEEWKDDTRDYLARKEQAIAQVHKDSPFAEEYEADMISEINIILDGDSIGENSCCKINGTKYILSNYVLSQELRHPAMLTFHIEKEDKFETRSDVIFADTSMVIGRSFEMQVSTVKASLEQNKAKPQKSFVFKGGIVDVASSRSTASAQYAVIKVATWDFLLENYPHCRSFENMTLKEIVTAVLKGYPDIHSKISPRFNQKIPYTVQYNQSDYAFLSLLAARYGEWMYNTGENFIFGELDNSDSKTAKLEYPGGSLMSYDLKQNLETFNFSHLLTNHYSFGKSEYINKETVKDFSANDWNDWAEKAFAASKKRFDKEHTQFLSAGGFDNGLDDEGATSILDCSVDALAHAKAAKIMVVRGTSKLAMLHIGLSFEICDKVQNRSGENEDVKQRTLKVVGINHVFDYQQEYENSFVAIPVACNYPAYTDANVFVEAPPQRAKVVDNKDPQKMGRIKIQFPWQEIQNGNMMTPWLRIAVPYAGGGKGLYFIPEVGEEVMVGFEMNNVERPYVIGALYNGGDGKNDMEWASVNEDKGTSNNVKAIRTRNGHTILFKDHGQAGSIEIYDNKSNAYHITFSADEKKVTVFSAGNIEMVAEDGIRIKSGSNISIEASNEISIQASQVKVR